MGLNHYYFLDLVKKCKSKSYNFNKIQEQKCSTVHTDKSWALSAHNSASIIQQQWVNEICEEHEGVLV